MANHKLRLLALDGGGVRGLSSLYLLHYFMGQVHPNGTPPKPCEYFDMICGTSTGGLIAIMLGRLHMSLEQCIAEYQNLASLIFNAKSKSRFPLTIHGTVKGVFSTKNLEEHIRDIIRRYGESKSDDILLYDEEQQDKGCKVFVCAMSQAKRVTRLRSYQCRWGDTDLLKRVKAWEAGRATSAATSFFEPMPLGDLGEMFVDGALGANNPVAELWDEAKEIWSGQPLEQQLGCVLSLGTGVPQLQAFSQSLKAVGRTILELATSAENIEKDFSRNHKDLALNGRYIRLNVLRGLGSIGLEDSEKLPFIVSATRAYVGDPMVQQLITMCITHGNESFNQITTQNTRVLAFGGVGETSPHYLQRDVVFGQLEEHRGSLSTSDNSRIILLYGLPGSGKTEVAKGYAKRLSGSGIGICWLDASSLTSLRKSLFRFGRLTELATDAALATMDIDELSQRVTDHIHSYDQEFLIVCDNYESSEAPAGYALLDHVSASAKCQVIITSRNGSPVRLLGRDTASIALTAMTEEEAILLLRRILDYVDESNNEDLDCHIQNIACKLMSRLPLAIAQAGAYIKQALSKQKSLLEALIYYENRYKSHEDSLLKATDDNFVKGYGKSVITTFSMSFQVIAQKNKASKELLLLCGFFHHREVRKAWFESACCRRLRLAKSGIDLQDPEFAWFEKLSILETDGSWDATEFDDCLSILNDYGLIHYNHKESHWSMHPLINTWAVIQQVQTSSLELEARARLAAAILAETYDDTSDWDRKMIHKLRIDLYDHLESWLGRCQSHTSFFTRPTSFLRAYTLSRIASFLDSTKLAPKHQNTSLLPKLRAIALMSGLAQDGLGSLYVTDKIERLMMHLSTKHQSKPDLIEGVFTSLRPLITTAMAQKEDFNFFYEIASNLLRYAACQTLSGHSPRAVAGMEQLLMYADEHKRRFSGFQYSFLRGHALSRIALSHSDEEKRSQALKNLDQLIQEVSPLVDEEDSNLVCFKSLFHLARTCWSAQDEEEHRRLYLAYKNKPSEFRAAFMHNLSMLMTSKLKSDLNGRELINLLEERIQIKQAEVGPGHLDVLAAHLQIFDHHESVRQLNGRSRYLFFESWPSRRQEIIDPISVLLSFKVRHVEEKITPLWTGLLAAASQDDASRQVLADCVTALQQAVEVGERGGQVDFARALSQYISSLGTGSEEFDAAEPLLQTFKRIQRLWAFLEQISAATAEAKSAPLAERQMLDELKTARGSVLESELFLVIKYLIVMIHTDSSSTCSPISLQTVEMLESIVNEIPPNAGILSYRFRVPAAVYLRMLRQDDRAIEIEEAVVQASAKELDCVAESNVTRQVLVHGSASEVGQAWIGWSKTQAGTTLEQIILAYSLKGWDDACRRLYESWIHSSAAKLGYLSNTVIGRILWCATYCERTKHFASMETIQPPVLAALKETVDIETTWRVIKQLRDGAYALRNMKSFRASIMIVEGLSNIQDATPEYAESSANSATTIFFNWSLLWILRKSYFDLGYTYNAEDLVQRQLFLEDKLLGLEVAETERANVVSIIEKDRRERNPQN